MRGWEVFSSVKYGMSAMQYVKVFSDIDGKPLLYFATEIRFSSISLYYFSVHEPTGFGHIVIIFFYTFLCPRVIFQIQSL